MVGGRWPPGVGGEVVGGWGDGTHGIDIGEVSRAAAFERGSTSARSWSWEENSRRRKTEEARVRERERVVRVVRVVRVEELVGCIFCRRGERGAVLVDNFSSVI